MAAAVLEDKSSGGGEPMLMGLPLKYVSSVETYLSCVVVARPTCAVLGGTSEDKARG